MISERFKYLVHSKFISMRRKTGALLQKRGIMGIGTLIIFIATILVAAVAAAVLISTSNVLQQRSLLVGQEARKTITDGVDVFSITAQSNATTEKFNNYEILLRLSPGSDPLQLRKFDVEMLTNKLHSTAMLNYPGDDNEMNASGDVTTTAIALSDDLDGDGAVDYVFIVDGVIDSLGFNLSSKGPTDLISLDVDVINGQTISLDEAPITIGDEVYGSVEISGDATGAATFPSNIMIVRKVASTCEFKFLPPEDYFCVKVLVGNDDHVLDSREKMKIYFKTKDENALTVSEDFMFIFASEKGRLTETRARTPDVVVYASTRIWPLS